MLERMGRSWWLGHVGLLAVSTGLVVLSAVLTPSTEALGLFGLDLPVLCTFRRLTGFECPGCGLTRSFVFMAHGAFVEAFRMNAIGPLLFVLVAAQVPYRIIRLVRGSASSAASRGRLASGARAE